MGKTLAITQINSAVQFIDYMKEESLYSLRDRFRKYVNDMCDHKLQTLQVSDNDYEIVISIIRARKAKGV